MLHSLGLIAAGIFIGLIVAAPIGPVNIICLRRTLAYGPLNGFFSGLGAALGDGVFAVITGFGLTFLADMIEEYSGPLKLAGGVMLLGFGLHIFESDASLLPRAEGAAARNEGSSSLFAAIASTFALTITNPATMFGFTALFAGIGSLAGNETSYADAGLMVGSVVAGSVAWWLALTSIVGIFHRHINETVMRNINHVFGLIVAGFGVVVLGYLALPFIFELLPNKS